MSVIHYTKTTEDEFAIT
jgi:hypothetical protein